MTEPSPRATLELIRNVVMNETSVVVIRFRVTELIERYVYEYNLEREGLSVSAINKATQ